MDLPASLQGLVKPVAFHFQWYHFVPCTENEWNIMHVPGPHPFDQST